MQLQHSFIVPADIDDAWQVLLDIERVAPCMPGASLHTVDGDEFTGTIKVKLGPIGLTYRGSARFVEKDDAGHRAALEARGRDARGNGAASAKITASLTEEGSQTHVEVHTDLDITGKPAQFGRGVMIDIGNKLIGQFADNLARQLGSVAITDVADTNPADAPSQPEAVNLLASAMPTILKRCAPALTLIAASVAVGRVLRHRRAQPDTRVLHPPGPGPDSFLELNATQASRLRPP